MSILPGRILPKMTIGKRSIAGTARHCGDSTIAIWLCKERVGFEPTNRLLGYTRSRGAFSTSQAPLQVRSARDRIRLVYVNTPLYLFTQVMFRDTESPGFEPGLLVLETRVLPLDDAPKIALFTIS